jgi:hypothetical protein
MQNKITKPSDLLDKCGKLIQKGYATKPLLKYNRKNVALKCRLREWDYYLAYNDKYAVAVTVGKIACIVFVSVSIIDFTTKKVISKTAVKLMSDKRFTMPESSETGDIVIKDKRFYVNICIKPFYRELTLHMKKVQGKNDLDLSLVFTQEPCDSMVLALPFKECNKLFLYNRKIIGWLACGHVKLGKQLYTFDDDDSYGLLNWVRGAFPCDVNWYWSVCQGRIYGCKFGLNLGYGLGDNSVATENMLFYKGIASKLDNVTFHIPKDKNGYQYMKPWKITSSDNSVELKFTPIVERKKKWCSFLFATNQHQVFGTFSGYAILDDKSIVLLHDFYGFAERIENRW